MMSGRSGALASYPKKLSSGRDPPNPGVVFEVTTVVLWAFDPRVTRVVGALELVRLTLGVEYELEEPESTTVDDLGWAKVEVNVAVEVDVPGEETEA